MKSTVSALLVLLLAMSHVYTGTLNHGNRSQLEGQGSSIVLTVSDLDVHLAMPSDLMPNCCDRSEHAKHSSFSTCNLDCKLFISESNFTGTVTDLTIWSYLSSSLSGSFSDVFLRPPIS